MYAITQAGALLTLASNGIAAGGPAQRRFYDSRVEWDAPPPGAAGARP